MKPGKIAVAIIAAILALVSIGLVVGGAALTWAFGTQRDADGFLTSPVYDLESEGYALTSTEVDLASRPGDWFPSGLADIRFEVRGAADTPVFVGIGPSSDVDRYLGSVARDEVTHLGTKATDIEVRSVAGGAPDARPAEQDFWVASDDGSGTRSLVWEVERGSWSVVVMNSDASAGVSVAVEAGARIGILIAIGVGLLLFGLLLGIIAAFMLVWATRSDREPAAFGAAPAVAGTHPVRLDGVLDPALSRWMWLVKWFLAIPHLIVLVFLWAAFAVLTVFVFFAILFTGRYPRGIFDFNVGVLRWTWRVEYYAFSALGTDRYPPFSLEATDYPADIQVDYPAQLSRGLVLVKWWLLALPHYIIVGLFTSGLVWWTTDLDGDGILQVGGGLIGILVLVAAVILGFTGRYPQGLFDLVMGLNRWVYRVIGYAGLMRDEYPPFRLDLGGTDPGSGADGVIEEPATRVEKE